MTRITALAALTLAATAVQYASATLGITYPVASTSCEGGDECGPFEWQVDDSVLPLAEDFGRSTVGIYTGSTNQQTLFLDLGTVNDPTKITEIEATTIPANLGPNGNFYFLRIESVSATDSVTGYPLQAFSAKFTLSGMTGRLSAEAQAQVDGTSSTTARVISTARVTVSKTTTSSSSAQTSGLNSTSNGSKNSTSSGASKNGTDTGAALPAYVNMGYTVAIGAGLAGVAMFAY